METSGKVLQADIQFIDMMKTFLWPLLMKNGASIAVDVFERTLQIFSILLSKFKTHFKTQIEAFYREVLLIVLESSTSSFQHK